MESPLRVPLLPRRWPQRANHLTVGSKRRVLSAVQRVGDMVRVTLATDCTPVSVLRRHLVTGVSHGLPPHRVLAEPLALVSGSLPRLRITQCPGRRCVGGLRRVLHRFGWLFPQPRTFRAEVTAP